MPYSHYKEDQFPQHYRQAAVAKIVTAVDAARSCQVIGTAGMGKSNVLRFVAAQASHWFDPGKYLVVHVDSNLVRTEAELLHLLCVELVRVGGVSDIAVADDMTYAAARSLLRRIVTQVDERHLICMIDSFDFIAKTAGLDFYGFLRALRDINKRVSYVFGLRRPLPAKALGELEELMVPPVWVGPFAEQDALDSIQRDELRLSHAFTASERAGLIAHSGGHPGFLKNCGELLASGQFTLSDEGSETAKALLRYQPIKNLCDELWLDRTEEERGVLWQVAVQNSHHKNDAAKNSAETTQTNERSRTFPSPGDGDYVRAQEHLVNAGLLTEELRSLCPLFALYVRETVLPRIVIDTERGIIRQGFIVHNLRLGTRQGTLLKYLVDNRGRRVPMSELLPIVYPDDAANQDKRDQLDADETLAGLIRVGEEVRSDIEAAIGLLKSNQYKDAQARMDTSLVGAADLLVALKALTMPLGPERIYQLVNQLRKRFGDDVIDSNQDGYLFEQPTR